MTTYFIGFHRCCRPGWDCFLGSLGGFQVRVSWFGVRVITLVAEWIHFTRFWILLPTIKLKVCTFGGIMNSATK